MVQGCWHCLYFVVSFDVFLDQNLEVLFILDTYTEGDILVIGFIL